MRHLGLLLLLVSSVFAQQQWSIGYWTPWTSPPCPIAEIDMAALTHVVHWAAVVNVDGTLDLDTQLISRDAPTLVSTSHAAGVKALLGVVQASWLGKKNSLQRAALENRATLVNNILSVVDKYGYDGVDLDWEPFDELADGTALHYLSLDLRQRLGTRLLTAAAIVTTYPFWGSLREHVNPAGGISWSFAHDPFDRINIMTYDMSGSWDPYSWHQSALYESSGLVWSVELAVTRFTVSGIPAYKLGIGLPFYGWQWNGGGITNPRQFLLTSIPSRRQVEYNAIAPTITATNYNFDTSAMAPYLSGADSFLTYDNEQSITAKVNYAMSNGLGGWIIWQLAGDYFPSGSPKTPLLAAVKQAMLAAKTGN